MADLRKLEFCLLRYVPNAVRGEFVNIGLMMKEPGAGESGFSRVRFTQDWRRVKCLDPQVNLDELEILQKEIERRSATLNSYEELMRWFADTHSNVIELSALKGVETVNPALELEEMAQNYLEGIPSEEDREREATGRRLLLKKMTEAFDRSGVTPLLKRNLAIAPKARPDAGLTFDFSYPLGNQLKLFHALSMKATPAIRFLKRYPGVRESVMADGARPVLTTLMEDDLDLRNDTIAFLIEEMKKQEIEVAGIGQMAQIAERAAVELRV